MGKKYGPDSRADGLPPVVLQWERNRGGRRQRECAFHMSKEVEDQNHRRIKKTFTVYGRKGNK